MQIGWQDALHDLFSVTRKLRIFFVFQIFGALAFVLLSQGKDVLQCLLEDVYGHKYIPALSLIAGTWFWSLAGEFGARMLLYLTDSSNDGISLQRKNFREETQRIILGAQAIFPFVLYLYALSRTFYHHYTYETENTIVYIFIGLFLILLLNLNWALHFYFGKRRANNPYFVPKEAYQQDIIKNLGNILVQNIGILAKYPQITPNMYNRIPGSLPPLIELSFKKAFPGFFRWCLRYLAAMLLLFVVVSFIFGEKQYYLIGTPGLLAIGFTCWLIFFYLLKLFEISKPFGQKYRYLNMPYSTIALVWVLLVSYCNHDHPLSVNTGNYPNKPTLGPKEFFASWYAQHKNYLESKDTTLIVDTCRFHLADSGTCCKGLKRTVKKVKVIFVNAEGGALRTGSFTSLLLGGIQDQRPEFKHKIFAFSTVSGGTFGANLFNATAYEADASEDSLLTRYTDYYRSVDFLAPVAAKLFFGEFVNYFIPHYFKALDREIALESAWKNSWEAPLNMKGPNRLKGNFYEAAPIDGSKPAVFINSTLVESGNRAIISNVKLDPNYFTHVFDLNDSIKDTISYATAISLSARFPLVSPGAQLTPTKGLKKKFHLVDGGYYDNQGGTTMCEVLNSLSFDPCKDSLLIQPYLIQTVFDAETEKESKGVSFLNELTEVVTGIYQTRNGHTTYANLQLQKKIAQMGGLYLELKVANSTQEIPNNWILSAYAVTQANTRVSNLLSGKDPIDKNRLLQFLEQCCPKPH